MPISEHDRALEQAKIELMTMDNTVFYADVLLSFKFVWDESIRTACVGGSTIRINPKFFVHQLSIPQRVGVLVHEVMHPVYMHPQRVGNRNHSRYNQAGDHCINLALLERGFSLPSWALADRQYRGMTTEEIYDLLPVEPDPEYEPDVEFTDDPKTQEYMEEVLIRASIRSSQEGDRPGTIPGDVQLFIDNLLKPKIKWQSILAKYKTKFAKTEYSFTKPRRRYWPMILPGMKGTTLIDLAVAVDISGSVSDSDFRQFVSDVAGIFKTCKPENIQFIQFDTKIKSIDKLQSIPDLLKVDFVGRGGTDIRPVIEWANENKPQLLLVFTDGEFKFHNAQYKKDLLWIIHNNPKFTAPFGKVTHYRI